MDGAGESERMRGSVRIQRNVWKHPAGSRDFIQKTRGRQFVFFLHILKNTKVAPEGKAVQEIEHFMKLKQRQF